MSAASARPRVARNAGRPAGSIPKVHGSSARSSVATSSSVPSKGAEPSRSPRWTYVKRSRLPGAADRLVDVRAGQEHVRDVRLHVLDGARAVRVEVGGLQGADEVVLTHALVSGCDDLVESFDEPLELFG